jgi:hypothetical protein
MGSVLRDAAFFYFRVRFKSSIRPPTTRLAQAEHQILIFPYC